MTRTIVPDDWYRIRDVSQPALSQDGRFIAYAVESRDMTHDATTAVWMKDLDDPVAPPRLIASQSHSPQWSPSGDAIALILTERGGYSRLALWRTGRPDLEMLTEEGRTVSGHAWSPDGMIIAYIAAEPAAGDETALNIDRQMYKLDGAGRVGHVRTRLELVDIATRHVSVLVSEQAAVSQPAWSPAGDLIAFVMDRSALAGDRIDSQIWIKELATGRDVCVSGAVHVATLPAFAPSGQEIAFTGFEMPGPYGAANQHLYTVELSLPDVAEPTCVTAAHDRSVLGWPMGDRSYGWAADGRRLIYLAADAGAIRVFTVETRKANPPAICLIDGDVRVESLTVAGTRIAFTNRWIDHPGEVYVHDLDGQGKMCAVTSENADLVKELTLARAERQSIITADGLMIEYFVVDATHRGTGTGRKIVIDIHGGPHEFHPLAENFSWLQTQCLAAAGYLVILPNIRGSQGYGSAFARANVGDWGGADWTDVTACLDAVSSPEDKHDRIFLTGYSYGGYMALHAAARNQRFRAIVAGAPVSDLWLAYGTSDLPDFTVEEMVGFPWDRPDEYIARSPARHLDQMTTPLLLIHRDQDLRCTIAHSELVFRGLTALGRPVRFIQYPGGGHNHATPRQFVHQVRATIDWFSQWESGATLAHGLGQEMM